jgi:atypical dual specificity phosphatase
MQLYFRTLFEGRHLSSTLRTVITMGKGGVPERWENYSNIGDIVKGTRFVPFKVPLKSHLLSLVPEGVDANWGLENLKESCPKLVLIVDLTNTARYYSSQHAQKLGFKYAKIMTQGHQVPNDDVVKQFYKAVSQVLDEEGDGVVGVHCTHGLNRTGYLICRYMVEKLGMDPEAAIAAFDTARGHKQERENYLAHLREKSWEKRNIEHISVEDDKAMTYGQYKRMRAEQEFTYNDYPHHNPQDPVNANANRHPQQFPFHQNQSSYNSHGNSRGYHNNSSNRGYHQNNSAHRGYHQNSYGYRGYPQNSTGHAYGYPQNDTHMRNTWDHPSRDSYGSHQGGSGRYSQQNWEGPSHGRTDEHRRNKHSHKKGNDVGLDKYSEGQGGNRGREQNKDKRNKSGSQNRGHSTDKRVTNSAVGGDAHHSSSKADKVSHEKSGNSGKEEGSEVHRTKVKKKKKKHHKKPGVDSRPEVDSIPDVDLNFFDKKPSNFRK